MSVVDDSIRNQLVAMLPRLRRFATGMTGNRDQADDLVQAACERALSRLNQWQPGTRLDCWMFRIVQTVWIDMKRKEKRQGQHFGLDQAQELASPGAEDLADLRLMLGDVRRAIAALPEAQRAVLLLTCVEGLPYREAAEVLDLPIGTVMSRLARARKQLNAFMDDSSVHQTNRKEGPADGSRRQIH